MSRPVDGQLSLFVDAPPNGNGNGHADLFETVRRLVAEPDMTAEEVRAVVADALEQLDWEPPAALLAKPCRCTRALVLAPGSTCHWCGHRTEAAA